MVWYYLRQAHKYSKYSIHIRGTHVQNISQYNMYNMQCDVINSIGGEEASRVVLYTCVEDLVHVEARNESWDHAIELTCNLYETVISEDWNTVRTPPKLQKAKPKVKCRMRWKDRTEQCSSVNWVSDGKVKSIHDCSSHSRRYYHSRTIIIPFL